LSTQMRVLPETAAVVGGNVIAYQYFVNSITVT
jgi:hypothetical protein